MNEDEIFEVNNDIESDDNDNTAEPVEKKNNAFQQKLKSFGKGFATLAKKAVVGVGNFATDTADKISTASALSKEKNALNKIFEQEATAFLLNNTAELIYAIKNINNQTLLFRANENIVCNIPLSSEGQNFVITDLDKKIILPYEKEGNSQKLDCFLANYKISESKHEYQQSVSQITNIIIKGDNSGDINAVNQAKTGNSLDEIEKIISTSRPNLFNKAKKSTAQEMFVAFKSNIINNVKPEKSFLDKFLAILKAIAPPAVSIVLSLL